MTKITNGKLENRIADLERKFVTQKVTYHKINVLQSDPSNNAKDLINYNNLVQRMNSSSNQINTIVSDLHTFDNKLAAFDSEIEYKKY